MNDNSKDNEILKINQLIKEKYSQKKRIMKIIKQQKNL